MNLIKNIFRNFFLKKNIIMELSNFKNFENYIRLKTINIIFLNKTIIFI